VKKIKQARLPTLKRFEDSYEAVFPKDVRKYLKELKLLKFLNENRNLILLGNSGIEKTHLASVLFVNKVRRQKLV